MCKKVVIDFEGFKYQKRNFIIKELAVYGEYQDTIYFLPPQSFSSLSKSEQVCYQWITKNLHGLNWESGNYPYEKLKSIFESISLRYPLSEFYAKGKEKSDFLSSLLKRPVINLDDLGCPKIEHIPSSYYFCSRHYFQSKKFRKHCARRKSVGFFNWLREEDNGYTKTPGNSEDQFVEQFASLSVNNKRDESSELLHPSPRRVCRHSRWSETSSEASN